MTIQERFEKKYERVPGIDCWLWTAASHEFGYGNFWDSKGYTTAHRVSYRLYVGEIPEGKLVLHHCDNPACVRPDHLFIGTTQDNIKDKISKGRQAGKSRPGAENPAAKLTPIQVEEIRLDKRPQRTIAKEYGVGKTSIARIKRRETWK